MFLRHVQSKRNNIWVLLNNGWLDRAWTPNPISVQPLSKPCPMSVQFQEKYRVCPIKYRVCPKPVECLSNSEALGQRLDMEIQYLAKICPIEYPLKVQFLTLHIIWTTIGYGQTVDKHWTWTVSGQTLDLTARPSPARGSPNTHSDRGQSLDFDKTLERKSGFDGPPKAHPWPTHGPPTTHSWLAHGPLMPCLLPTLGLPMAHSWIAYCPLLAYQLQRRSLNSAAVFELKF